jgi:hypothetical protein
MILYEVMRQRDGKKARPPKLSEGGKTEMIILQRPGGNPLEIEFILLNFEGTLATDRRVHPKAKDSSTSYPNERTFYSDSRK